MSKHQVAEQLARVHPQFKDKSKLIDYYMNFQFPEKQRSSAIFWQKVLENYLVIRNKLTFSLQQLQDFFYMHSLKPLPLKNLLRFFVDKGTFEWSQKVIQKDTKQSWWNAMIGIMWKSQQNINYVELNPQKKILIASVVQKKMREMKQIVPTIFQQFHVIEAAFFEKEAERALHLSEDLIIIINRLQEQGFFKREQLQNGQLVLVYTNDPKNMSSQKWRSIQKTKFIIGQKIQEFDAKITEKCRLLDNLLSQAKQYLERNDRKKAKMILMNHKIYEKNMENFNLRKQTLINTLHQIQMNEINNVSVDILKISQDVIKETAIDNSEIDDLMQKNRQIKYDQKMINDQFKEVNEMDNDDNSVEQMMKQIQSEVIKQKNSVSKQRFVRPQLLNMDIQQSARVQPSFTKKQAMFN